MFLWISLDFVIYPETKAIWVILGIPLQFLYPDNEAEGSQSLNLRCPLREETPTGVREFGSRVCVMEQFKL